MFSCDFEGILIGDDDLLPDAEREAVAAVCIQTEG